MSIARFVIILSITALLSLSCLAAPFSSDADVIEDVNDQITQTLDKILESDTGAEDDRKKRELPSVTQFKSPFLQKIKDDESDEESDDTDEASKDEDVDGMRKKRSILDEISSIGSLRSSPTSVKLTNDAKIDDMDGNDNGDDKDDDDDDDDDDNDRRKRDIDSQMEEDEDDDEDGLILERKKRDTETEIDGNEDNDDDEIDENDLSDRRKRDTDADIIDEEDDDGISDILDMVKRDTQTNMAKRAAVVKRAPIGESGKVLITRKAKDISGVENNDDDDDDDDEDADDDGEAISERKKRDTRLNQTPIAPDKIKHSDESGDIPIIQNERDDDDGEKKRKKRDLQTEIDENDDDFDEDDDDSEPILRRKRDLSDDEEIDSDDDEGDAADDDDNHENSERRKREAIEDFIDLENDDDDDDDDNEDEDTITRVRRTAQVKPTSPTAQPSTNKTSATPTPSSDGLLQTFLQKSEAKPFTASSSNDADDDDDDDNEADDDDDDDDEDDDDDDDDDDTKASNKKKELQKQLRSLVKSIRKQKREAPGYVPTYTDADDDLQKNDILTENPVAQINQNNTQKHTHIHVSEPSDFNIDGYSKKSPSTMIDVHPHAPDIVQHTSSNDVSLATTKHLGGEPSGPIARKRSLDQRYSSFFTKDAKRRVAWVEPKMMKNCWAQSMLASRFGYSPSCNADGSFSPKQCFLERCWCVHKDGSPQDPNIKSRFVYSIAAIMMECAQSP